MPVPNTQTAFNTAVASLMQDKTASIEALTALAAGDSPEAGPAARVLGMLALKNYNDPDSLGQAIKHLERAAACGDAEGMFQLAVVYQGMNNPEDALSLYERSTRLGHEEAAIQWLLRLYEQHSDNLQLRAQAALDIGKILYGATQCPTKRNQFVAAVTHYGVNKIFTSEQHVIGVLDLAFQQMSASKPSLDHDNDIGPYAAGTTDVSDTPPFMAP